MKPTFDWDLVNLTRWTPLADATGDAEPVIDYMFRMAPCVYAFTNTIEGAVERGLGIGAILWAESEDAARLIYRKVMTDVPQAADCLPPPGDVLGFDELSFDGVMSYESGGPAEPIRISAIYELKGGRHAFSELRGERRKYYFRELNPAGSDRVIAIRFELPPD